MIKNFKIALFPIPNTVAFPGMKLPLHVFEPRYRKMVQDCIDMKLMIGVCHTVKEIRSAKKFQSLTQKMNSNQATYVPHTIFSAGYCHIVKTMDDGRLLVEIDVQDRFKECETIQQLPYKIVQAQKFKDCLVGISKNEANQNTHQLRSQIIGKIEQLINTHSKEENPFEIKVDFQDASDEYFSFQIYHLLQFDPDYMQMALEAQSPKDRMEIAWSLLQFAE